jgi:hypothetical protein
MAVFSEMTQPPGQPPAAVVPVFQDFVAFQDCRVNQGRKLCDILRRARLTLACEQSG